MLLVAAAVLGAIVGSFLNALLFRWGTGRSVMHGRSRCMHCGTTLVAADLVPIFSYLFLRGRCRTCSARVSWQYPLVEAAGAALGLLTYFAHPDPLAFAFWFVVWMTLLFVFVYDLRHKIIPWSALLMLVVLAAGYLAAVGASWELWLAGPVLAAPLLFLWLVSRGRAMGLGDAPLELALGALLGPVLGASALLMAFVLGALVGSALLVAAKRYTMRSEIPFAPFLIGGALLAHFFHVNLFQILSLLAPLLVPTG